VNYSLGNRCLWVFDFDGTISPIVPDRDAAQLHPSCRDLLKQLAAGPGNFVTVLSSRSIEDLASRVRLPGVILGGASGLEWRLPGGHRVLPGDAAKARRDRTREAITPHLARLASFPGVDLEDKGWSVAVHLRRVLPEAQGMLEPLLGELGRAPGIRVFRGPSVAEVLLLAHVTKSFGVRRICRILEIDPSGQHVLYAGDDENDAVAIRWVLKKGGTALCVGDRLRIPGAIVVDGPAGLARTVRQMVMAGPRACRGKRKEVTA
jgi:trehalose 6-phosphate phosphatase